MIRGSNSISRQFQHPSHFGMTSPDQLGCPGFLSHSNGYLDLCGRARSEEHTSELQSQSNIVCRLLLEKKNTSNIILSKWVFKTKYNQYRRIHRHKTRLVSQGFSQNYVIDYTETFAPTLRYESLRILLA